MTLISAYIELLIGRESPGDCPGGNVRDKCPGQMSRYPPDENTGMSRHPYQAEEIMRDS